MTELTPEAGEHSSRFENNNLPTLAEPDQSVSPSVLLDYLDNAVDENEMGHREYLKQVLSKAAVVAAMLSVDTEAWLAFIGHPRWNGAKRRPKATDQDDALRYVLRWLFDRRPSGPKLANKYYRAVKNVLNTGARPSKIPTFIEEFGIEELAYLKNGAKVSSSRVEERVKAIAEDHGAPLFIMKAKGKLEHLPSSKYPINLNGYWVEGGVEGGCFMVYEVDEQSFALVTPGTGPRG